MPAAAQTTTGEIILWCLVLIGGIAVLGAFVWLVRRWAFATPEEPAEEWSLQHLRDLKAKGELTQQEFETLKEKMIQQYKEDEEQ